MGRAENDLPSLKGMLTAMRDWRVLPRSYHGRPSKKNDVGQNSEYIALRIKIELQRRQVDQYDPPARRLSG